MAFFDLVWYANAGDQSTTGHYAVPKHAASTAYTAGQIVRQFTTPAVGNERCFVCIVAGTSAAATDATWVLTRGAKTTDGTVTWIECTGATSMNGDQANTQSWAQVKAIGSSVTIGQIIKRNSGTSYQVCTLSSGNTGASEPAFSDTAGATTVDGSATWTSLGLVGSFTNGGAPHAKLGNVFVGGWFVSGNTVYVGDNHAESVTGTIGVGAATALMAKILCHNHSGAYPPGVGDITTGATFNATSLISVSGQGSYYFYGLRFNGVGFSVVPSSVGQTQNWYYFDSCVIQTGSSSISLGATSTAWGIVILNNTTVHFGSAAIRIIPYFLNLVWQNTGPILASGSAIPTNLFQYPNSSGRFANITLTNLDLSQLTGSLFDNSANSSIGSLLVQDCKLNAAMTVTTPINSGMRVEYVRSDSAGTSYKSRRITYEGIESTETTIVRTGGAVDPSGQAQSRKIVTSATAEWLRPYKAEPLAIWNPTVGSPVTVTVCGTLLSSVLPYNDELWMEVEYLGDAGVPATTFDTGTASAVTLSNGNKTVTCINNQGGARSILYATSGKYYFELTLNTWFTGIQSALGLVSTAGTYVNMFNDGTNSTDILCNSGNILSNGGGTGFSVGAPVANDVICVAVDLDNRKAWFRRNGGNWNGNATHDPASGAGGVTVQAAVGFAPAVAFPVSGGVGEILTGNFGASTFAYAVPSGFMAGWGVPASTLGTIVSTTKSNLLAGGSPVAVDSSVWGLPPTVTWDAATITAVTLSGGNLVATNTGTTSADQGAHVAFANGKTSGKYYFEVTWGTFFGSVSSNVSIGIGTTASTYTSLGPNATTGVVTYKSGAIYANGSSVVTWTLWTNGHTAQIAIDLDNRRAWFRDVVGATWNNSGTADPATNVGGVAIPAGTMVPFVTFGGTGGAANNVFTANFGASAFSGTVPSGFTSGWPQ